MSDSRAVHTASKYATWVVVGAAFGGLLFGYDQGVISGAVNFIKTKFALSSGLLGFISACIPLGAMVGCLFAGTLADRVGRRFVLSTAAILFVISSVGCAIAPHVMVLITFRLLGGIGVGMASTLVPVYISEVAPQQIRGKMVGGYQLAVASGILVVYLVNALIARSHGDQWNQDLGWRFMFLAGAIPGLLFFVIMHFIPESPRYLVKSNRSDSAQKVLGRLYTETAEVDIRNEVSSIESTIREESKGFWGEIFKKGFRMALFVGMMAAVFQQVTGVAAVAYYAPLIFKQAGAGTNAALLQTVALGLVKVIFVVVFMLVVDHVGRKRLLQWGAVGMAVCLFGLSWAFDQNPMTRTVDLLILAMLILHTIFFELSWGGGAWVLISEIFPNRIRGRASSICSFTLWAATFAVTLVFPVMLTSLGNVWTYVIFGGFCVIMAAFTHFFIYETAGKSLEEIQHDTAHGLSSR